MLATIPKKVLLKTGTKTVSGNTITPIKELVSKENLGVEILLERIIIIMPTVLWRYRGNIKQAKSIKNGKNSILMEACFLFIPIKMVKLWKLTERK